MNKSKSLFLNILFLTFAAAGSYIIFRSGGTGAQEYMFYLPAALTLLYGLIIGIALVNCSDSAQAEHWSDTVYFTGFIFTLVSLSFLFYRFYSGDLQTLSAWIISDTFYYIGISVTTSVAGVLLKNMVRASWLRRNPEADDGLAKTYKLMKETAESFSSGYEGVFSSIGEYLQERRENAKAFDREEKDLLCSFAQFRNTIDEFNKSFSGTLAGLDSGIQSSTDLLAQQRRSIEQLIDMNSDSKAAAEYFSAGMNSIAFDELSANMNLLRRESEELNGVLDSIIRIIDMKVQKVG